MDAFVANLTPYLSDPAVVLVCAAVFFVVLAAIAVYIVTSAPRRASAEVARLVSELDAVTRILSESERIGKFGSFAWDFREPSASFWSQEMFELCGLVPRKAAPSIATLLSAAHPADREAATRQWSAAQHRPGPFTFDFRTLARSGEVRYLRVQGKSTMAGTQPQRIEGAAQDVTREAEVDKAKTEFVSLASHQLKTPLTSIAWLSEMLLSDKAGALTPQQREYLTRVHHETMRMTDMVNELLNISRIELGTLAVTLAEFDVCALLREVFEEQHHAAEARKIAVNLVCGNKLPQTRGDQSLVRMILQNLLSNAIKYSKAGGTVECEISSSGLHKDALTIRVQDQGIGIPENEQGRMFERLHRAGNARAQVPDGTGLGLYLVKLIVERAGGKISFDSKEGSGTTFYVSLPFVWTAAPAPAQPAR